jgi:Fe-S cluster assembly protein SufD
MPPLAATHLFAQGVQANARGGPFAVVNGAVAADVLVVALPAGVTLQQPLHVLHVSTAAASPSSNGSSGAGVLAASAGRLLISLQAGASAEVVEEFVAAAGGDDAAASGAYITMPVAEVALGEGASLKHGYVQREAAGAQHFKATLVSQVGRRASCWGCVAALRRTHAHTRGRSLWQRCMCVRPRTVRHARRRQPPTAAKQTTPQAEGSVYELVEARLGGALSRHDVGVEQAGPETTTTMRHFILAGVCCLAAGLCARSGCGGRPPAAV